jgi:polyisoprenoid-binding protein YceI
MFKNLRRIALLSLAVLSMMLTANAATVAEYEQTPAGVPELQVRYNHDAGTLTAVDGTTGDEGGSILFDFDASLLGPAFVDVPALLYIDATATGAGFVNLDGTFGRLFSGEIRILRASDNANLLTATFDRASLNVYGSGGSTFSSDPAGNIDFSSDFLSFGNFTDAFSLALVDVSPPQTTVLGNFAASSSGRFSSDFKGDDVVPEPASMALIGGGLLGVAFLRRRRMSA